jgi:phosphate uptake regulator
VLASVTPPRRRLVSGNLERIADHSTKVAEDVIYIVRGEDVRERGDKELRKGLRFPTPNHR